mmetsp:Transcript_9036/g.1318  ORF Transcript_9036/g.1318 Transcript_9036/m.1318 type:complete len:148 (+) Transcript_9036:184-627(+)
MFFIIDIVLTFRTSFFSSVTGDEIIDPNLIAKNYIMGKLWIDILSCFPSDIFSSLLEDDTDLNYSSLIGLFGLLKVYRISRLNRIVAFMRAKNDVKSVLRIGQLIFFLIMYVHLVSCGWWIIVKYDENWIPPSDPTDIFSKPSDYQY